jgi:hypothetical protein
MLTPIFFLIAGLSLVLISTIGFVIAQATRNWFFAPEPRAGFRLIDLPSDPGSLEPSVQAA